MSTAIHPEVIAILKQMRPDLEICPCCKCCEMVTEHCEQCGGDGCVFEDEDPETFEDEVYTCDACLGKGYFTFCGGSCDKHGKHKEKGGPA